MGSGRILAGCVAILVLEAGCNGSAGGPDGAGAQQSAPVTSSGMGILPGTLPQVELGVPYGAALLTTNVTGPITWSVIGTLPPGITLGSGTASANFLLGTATAAGSYSFEVEVSNGTGSQTNAFTIVVTGTVAPSPAPTPAFILDPLAGSQLANGTLGTS